MKKKGKPKRKPAGIGRCKVKGCAAPAVEEIHWPAAKPEKFCAPHAAAAKSGTLPRPPKGGAA